MALKWKALKDNDRGERDRLYCTTCNSTELEVRSEPVKRKRHSREGHRRRIVAVCCGSVKRLAYGGARGRRKARAKASS